LATQTKKFNISWMGQYRAKTNSYYGGGSPIRVGGTDNYQSYIGFPTALRDALNTSKTATTMKLKIYVTDPTSEWDVGAHKETYNKASGTMPWYTYIGAYHISSTGWITIDLTNNFMNSYKNGTYHGVVLYSGAGSSYYGEAYGVRSDSYCAYVEITGDWNDPPSNPTITYPKGGEIIDQSITVLWNPASDPDGDSLYYQVALYDGQKWTYYNTGYGATSYTINTSNVRETSNAKVALRASDGKVWSPSWVYSNTFTINHNQAPTAPTQVIPSTGEVRDRTQVIRFSWKHNDDGAQAGFRLAWRTVASDGTRGAWNYIPNATSFINSTNQYYDMPAYTLPASDIEWGVKTKDQQGLESPYSAFQIFKASEPTNAPTILSPVHMSEISSSTVTVEWSSLNQQQYDLALYDTDGFELFREVKTGSTKKVTIPVQLENNKWYEIYLRVMDSTTQLWSDYTTVSFGTNFVPPLTPVLERFEEAGDGVLNIFYGAPDYDILPSFTINEGEQNPLLTAYNGSVAGTDYTILSPDSVQITGANKGVEYWLTIGEIPLNVGDAFTVNASLDVQGGKLLIGAYDDADNNLALNETPVDTINSPTGDVSLSLTIPEGTTKLRVLFATTLDNTNTVTHSYCRLYISNAQTATEKIEIWRREYTPTLSEPWICVGKDLPPTGAFLDYTLASDVFYEYKIRAINDTNKTMSESHIGFVSITFNDTFLQEAHNLSNIILLKYATSREVEMEIDGRLMQFAGRKDPVREFGEHEQIVISVEWVFDTYAEVKMFKDMIRKRDVLLYRDRNGRRYWVTCDSFDVKDQDVNGFVLSADFYVTDYNEDLSTYYEEEAEF
jgi:hypothetical protein